MSKILYVILLEYEKFFVYCTDSTEQDKIFMECAFLFSFVKINKPIEIIEIFYTIDAFDVDKIVKKYMAQYGIDNVRGGSYQNQKLNHYQETILRQELAYANTSGTPIQNPSLKMEEKMRYFIYNELYYALSNYNDDCNEIPKLHKKIKDQQERYDNIHKKLGKILWVRKQNYENPEKYTSYMLDKTIIEKIQYLQKYIFEKKFTNETQNGPNREIIQLYNELMTYFNHFNCIFQENDFNLCDFTQTDIQMVYISHPEFIFSPYVHLSRYNQSMSLLVQDRKINEVSELCKIFEGICYWCLNRIDEYDFDLKSIPENIKLKSEMVDFLLKFHKYDTCV